MKTVRSFVVVMLFLLPLSLKAVNQASLQASYKKIGDGLVDLRKQFPDVQAKIYGILDQVDSIYKTARVALEENNTLTKRLNDKELESKESLKSKDLENISLQNEVVALKSVLDSTQHKLEVAVRNLEMERKYAKKLSQDLEKVSVEKRPEVKEKKKKEKVVHQLSNKNRQQRDKLEAMAEKSLVHSLNLTSTSVPNSPR